MPLPKNKPIGANSFAPKSTKFWKTKALEQFTDAEWEALCDGCGKCCLHKLEDEDTGDIYYTRVACKLLDLKTCRCKNYTERTNLVPDCLDLRKLTPEQYQWLPSTCAYRLLFEKKPLPRWHPLLSKTKNSVDKAGQSVQRYAITENDSHDLEDFIIEWLE